MRSLDDTHVMNAEEKEKYFKKRRIANRFLVVYNTNKHKKALLGKRFYGLTNE